MILLHEINPKLDWLLAPEPDLGYGRFRPMSLVGPDKAFCAESMKWRGEGGGMGAGGLDGRGETHIRHNSRDLVYFSIIGGTISIEFFLSTNCTSTRSVSPARTEVRHYRIHQVHPTVGEHADPAKSRLESEKSNKPPKRCSCAWISGIWRVGWVWAVPYGCDADWGDMWASPNARNSDELTGFTEKSGWSWQESYSKGRVLLLLLWSLLALFLPGCGRMMEEGWKKEGRGMEGGRGKLWKEGGHEDG